MMEKNSSQLSNNDQNSITVDEAYKKAVNFYNANLLEEASQLCLAILQVLPNHFNALNLLGNISFTKNNYELAIEQFQKAISINTESADAHSNVGLAYQAIGRMDDAITSYKKAISINPEFANAYSNLGNTLSEQYRLIEAVKCYQKAISINPKFVKAHYNLGNTLKEQGKFDEAVISYQKAISIYPEFANAYYNLGNTLKEQGKFDEAVTNYQKAISIYPQHAEAYYGLSKIFSSSDLKLSESYLQKSLEIDQNCGVYGKREYQRVILLKKQFANKADINARLLGTISRSGTMYSRYFFSHYDKYLSGTVELSDDIITPLFHQPNSLGFDIFNVIHSGCPGFNKANDNNIYNDNKYIYNGYTRGDEFVSVLNDEYSPSINKNVRIASLHRNPFDQAVSFFFHCKNHIDSRLRFITHVNNQKSDSEAIVKYFFDHALGSYIRHYYTFKHMSDKFPQQVRMFKYEQLIADPTDTFGNILKHFGHDPFIKERSRAFADAIKNTEIRNMKKLESRKKITLGNDQLSKESSHIKSGKVGRWKQYFGNSELVETEKRLQNFGISLDDFILE
ncbi:MAG: tetratricopeptide repeat protein [Magnetococcales bacterium]|nr:tetratricopeptide repeat protein [Magnetococcales bacterium]